MAEARGYLRRNNPASLAEQQELYRDIRARLRGLRLHLGLTEGEMAARLGISVRACRYRERQGTRLPLVGLIVLAREFDVSIEWLAFGGTWNTPRNDRRPIAPDGRPIRPRFRIRVKSGHKPLRFEI